MGDANKDTRSGLWFPTTPGHRYDQQWLFLSRFAGYTTTRHDQCLTLWFRAGGDVQRLILERGADGVRVWGPEETARRILRVGLPPLLPLHQLPADPPAHRLLRRRFGGARPVLFADPFEGLAWTILGQQITVAFAARLKADIAARYGTWVDDGPARVAVFPHPGTLAALSVDDLRALKLSRQKAETLKRVADMTTAGELDFTALTHMATADALARLQSIPGVGPWTAEYVLLRVLGHPDVLPAADVGLQRAWARLTGGSGRVSEAELRQAGSAWAGWRSDFAFLLWLDNQTNAAAVRSDETP